MVCRSVAPAQPPDVATKLKCPSRCKAEMSPLLLPPVRTERSVDGIIAPSRLLATVKFRSRAAGRQWCGLEGGGWPRDPETSRPGTCDPLKGGPAASIILQPTEPSSYRRPKSSSAEGGSDGRGFGQSSGSPGLTAGSAPTSSDAASLEPTSVSQDLFSRWQLECGHATSQMFSTPTSRVPKRLHLKCAGLGMVQADQPSTAGTKSVIIQ